MIDNKQAFKGQKSRPGRCPHKRCLQKQNSIHQDNSIHQLWKLLHWASVPLDVMALCVQPGWQLARPEQNCSSKNRNVKQQHTREQGHMEQMLPKRYAVVRGISIHHSGKMLQVV